MKEVAHLRRPHPLALWQVFVQTLVPDAPDPSLQSLFQTSLALWVCISICRMLKVGVSRVISGNCNRVSAIGRLAVLLCPFIVAHEWTVRQLDTAVAVKVALVDGVVLKSTVERVRWLALSVNVVLVIGLYELLAFIVFL